MSTRQSFALSFAQRYSDLAIRLTGTVILARLLGPAEFGAFAVAAACLGIGWVVAQFGLETYLVQERELTSEALGTAFAISLAANTLVACLFAGAALLAPDWLVGPVLADLLLILTARFLLAPLALPLSARLQQEMRFGMLYATHTARALIGVSVAIVLAAGGMGAASLAVASVAEAACMAGAALLLVRRYPLPKPGLARWRATLGFGGTPTLISALKQSGDAAPSLALASLAGYGAAGLFSRGQAVVALFDRGVSQAITPVVLPLLASRRREGGSLTPIYLKNVAYVSALAWPFFLFVTLFADSVVRVLLGDGWVEAVPTVQLLALAGLLLPLVQMNQKFYVALDQQHAYLRVQIVNQFGKIALVLVLCIVDFRLVALAFLFENALKAAQTCPALRRQLGYQPHQFWGALRASAWATLAALAVPLAVAAAPLPGGPMANLAVAAPGAAAGWIAAILLGRHPLSDEVARVTARLKTWAPPGLATLRRRRVGE